MFWSFSGFTTGVTSGAGTANPSGTPLVFIEVRTKGKLHKEKLKKPKGQSEALNRRIDNTVAKRIRAKGQNIIYKTVHRKLRINTRCHENI
jgi:hypothetical protein